jgi:hypothetical protein
MIEPCRSARCPPLMASRLSTSPGSLPIAQRSPKILNSSPALLRSVWRFFLLPIRPPKSMKSAPCTLTPAQPKSGFARWTAPSPFLFLLTINYLLLPFARPSPHTSRDLPPGRERPPTLAGGKLRLVVITRKQKTFENQDLFGLFESTGGAMSQLRGLSPRMIRSMISGTRVSKDIPLNLPSVEIEISPCNEA